jgi:hypothetical protein
MQVPTVRYRHKNGQIIAYNVSYVAMHLGEFDGLERVGDSSVVQIAPEMAFHDALLGTAAAEPVIESPSVRRGRPRKDQA